LRLKSKKNRVGVQRAKKKQKIIFRVPARWRRRNPLPSSETGIYGSLHEARRKIVRNEEQFEREKVRALREKEREGERKQNTKMSKMGLTPFIYSPEPVRFS